MVYGQGYFNLPRFIGVNYGDTEQLRCITVFVPDGDEYVGQLLALMNVAGQKPSWFTPNDAMRVARSEIWQEAYRKTYEAIMCGCFDCDDVAGCVEDSDAVKNALSKWLAAGGSSNEVGQPLPMEKLTENIVEGTNPTCDKDILWAQCIGLVQWCNLAIEQFFQGFETLTNPLEIAGAVSQAPVLDEIGLDAIISYAQMAQNAIQENYAADYSPTYEEDLACEIFCACSEDCQITLDRVLGILQTRIEDQWGSLLDLDSLVDMLNDLLTMDIEVVNVADMIYFMLFGSAKLANFGLNITAGFDAIQRAILVFNEPSDDWEVLCDECAETHYLEIDFTVASGGFVATGATGTRTDGIGWQDTYGGSPTASRLYIRLDWTGVVRIDEMEMLFQRTPAAGGFWDMSTVNGSTETIEVSATNSTNYPAGSIGYANIASGDGRNGDAIQLRVNSSPTNTDARITRLRIKIFGTLPPELEINGWTPYTP